MEEEECAKKIDEQCYEWKNKPQHVTVIVILHSFILMDV